MSCYDSIPDDATDTTNIDEGCTEDKPYCKNGSCVTCYDSITDDATTTTNTDMGCDADKPYCKNGSCVACQKTLNAPHLGCDADAPLCDNGQCVACYPDETKLIDPGCTQEMPSCKNGKCQACETDADCPTSKPEERDGAYYCDEGQCKKCDNSTPFRAEGACWACHNTGEGQVKDDGCHEYEKPFCVVEEGKSYGSKCGECTEDAHCTFNPNEVCNLDKNNPEGNTCVCADGYKRDDNGKCVQCTQSSDCADLTTFCVTDDDENYGTCQPCSTEDNRAARPTQDSETCECPPGLRPFFSSTRATSRGGNGGAWTCTTGCSQHIHCPENECCSCTGSECKAPGTCSGTDANGDKWYRPQTSNEACTACKPCEKYDAETNQCVANCEEGEACVPQAGGGNDPNNANLEEVCGGWACVRMKADLIHFTGRINNRDFYIPPTDSYFRMTHAAAARFCELNGYKLASLAEACDKDYAYDSGNDCPNITGNQSFTDKNSGKTYLLKWWHVARYGSFWLADISTDNALRVTYSCGNNHMANMCSSFYPLCTTK